ncbi:MAG: flagellar biosynthesis anti-sigma factor FlgM [Pirellulaceae bacterium]|jgi:negative regulator of flagellin synthesis FlgM|nr:flagellar biosynthesis anti-sigma factor FlgM [Pirellulaceae bacterium]
MRIHGSAHVHGPQAVNTPHRNQQQPAQPSAPTRPPQTVDQLDLSPAAEFVSDARALPEIRTERVAEIRAAIEAGAYESAEKLDVALDRLLDEIG